MSEQFSGVSGFGEALLKLRQHIRSQKEPGRAVVLKLNLRREALRGFLHIAEQLRVVANRFRRIECDNPIDACEEFEFACERLLDLLLRMLDPMLPEETATFRAYEFAGGTRIMVYFLLGFISQIEYSKNAVDDSIPEFPIPISFGLRFQLSRRQLSKTRQLIRLPDFLFPLDDETMREVALPENWRILAEDYAAAADEIAYSIGTVQRKVSHLITNTECSLGDSSHLAIDAAKASLANGEPMVPPPADGMYDDLQEWVNTSGRIKLKQQATVQALIDRGGRLSIADLKLLCKFADFNSLKREVNKKLKQVGWKIDRFNNEARLVLIKPRQK